MKFQDLKDFLDSATNGFIYFSLGTIIQSHQLTKDKVKVILDTLKELPYKVLWKYGSDDLPEKSTNIKVMKWVPQQDVLGKNKLQYFQCINLFNNLIIAHPNIKLFITHGGLHSAEEAIGSHVPMIVMPFFSDQPYNARKLEYKKVAKIVFPHDGFKKELFKERIMQVIKDPM